MATFERPAWYAANYCEENVWRLLALTTDPVTDTHALFVSNAQRACPMWSQRAAPAPGEPVVWDYHAVLLGRTGNQWKVWDMDSVLPCPCAAGDWLEATFPLASSLERAWQPRFRLVSHAHFKARFASDRSHMRTANGGYSSPPPPYPPIATPTETHTLFRFVDMEQPFVGTVLDLPELRAWLGRS